MNIKHYSMKIYLNKFSYLQSFKSGVILFLSLVTLINLNAQKTGKKGKFIEFTVSPSLGFRVLGNYNPPENYYSTDQHFKDSLRNADRPGQSLNLGINYVLKKDNFNQISFGLTYVHKTFQRVRTNISVGDLIHKDIGVVAGLVQAGILEVHYNFNYKYLEGSMLWHTNITGSRRLKDMDLWFFGGFAPNFLVTDKMKIQSVGFTLDGKNKHWVSNPEFKPFRFNVDLRAGLRLEQIIFKRLNGLVQPNFRMPVLPAFHGAQTVWIPQLGIDVGFSYKLNKTLR